MRFQCIAIYCFGFSLFLLSCQPIVPEVLQLSDNWQFREADSATWRPASVPGAVHLDLLNSGMIPDPFFGDNETRLQWIGERRWEYRTSFDGRLFKGRDRVELVFEGLDTYAEVYLNDSLVIFADNMFRTWVADIGSPLAIGGNELRIIFLPPESKDSAKGKQVPYALPESRGFTRKAPFQYGWDWGPKFLTAGVWRPAYIRAWNVARIEDVYLSPDLVTDSLAIYEVHVNVLAESNSLAILELSVNGTEVREFKQKVELKSGKNTFAGKVSIPDPALWWPNGMGEQPLYSFEITLNTGRNMDTKTIKTGIRKVELVQEKDSIGESFYFRVNGQPVFIKGANYIPMDNFPSRVELADYRRAIRSAVDANMNMLRVWGGGIYERDAFYDLCDETGILVWQDFMFACNMYPGDEIFLDNVAYEAEQQVRRLRNHPSVVLWCGNNEVDEGWHNWGWQRALNYSPEDSAAVWSSYLSLFHELLPQTVAAHSPHTPYVSSSPRIGWGHEEALREGDMHYWGVWWGEEPFEIYEAKVGRFMSEYGFQGFPPLKTIESFTFTGDTLLESEAIANHQKHPRGMELIRTYMERDYPVPGQFSHYAYVSQLVQAYGVKVALEAHRRAKPRCMGTLYWQLNDCWPVISWSSLDYYGRWKALHYFTREAYGDCLVSFETTGDEVTVFVVSDHPQPMSGELEVTLVAFDGTRSERVIKDVVLPANSSQVCVTREFSGFDRSSHLVRAVFRAEDGQVAENIFYFVPVKDMDLRDPGLTYAVIPGEEEYKIEISAAYLAKNILITCAGDGFFSDNYFDLLPGEQKVVYYYPKAGEEIGPDDLKVLHMELVMRAMGAAPFH